MKVEYSIRADIILSNQGNLSLQIRIAAENGLKVLSSLINLLLLAPCHPHSSAQAIPLQDSIIGLGFRGRADRAWSLAPTRAPVLQGIFGWGVQTVRKHLCINKNARLQNSHRIFDWHVCRMKP